MAPAVAGRTGETKGWATGVWVGEEQGVTGFDDGCLRGRLGRTRFGENELNMAAAEKVEKFSQTKQLSERGSHTPNSRSFRGHLATWLISFSRRASKLVC